MGGGVSKQGNYFQGPSWASTRQIGLRTRHWNLKSLYRGPNGIRSHIPPRWSLKAPSLKMAPTMGVAGRAHIPRMGVEVETSGASDVPHPALRSAGTSSQ